ncbi:MAG TPA: beta-N-acetylhexosaminidase [Candidatus Acidoferrum sp.]|nr:beta-N-acetylhexosaminidase [Candidatus Acidoferrum sp.]
MKDLHLMLNRKTPSSLPRIGLSALLAVAALAAPAFASTLPVIPLPVTMQPRAGVFTLCPALPVPGVPSHAVTRIYTDGASFQNGQYLAMMLFRSTGYEFIVATNNATGPIRGAVLLTTANAIPALGAEGYELTVAPDSVVVRAPAQAGVFYGVQSFLQLLPPQIMSTRAVSGVAWTAPCVYIQDQPRFQWRGVMLDVSRHFVDKQEVKRILDGLALHKINRFHWHLTDDHGWRLQITNSAWTTLTSTATTNTGAWRTGIDYGQNPAASTAWNSIGKYGGYYTQDDIREVVAYAQQRFITIVPEVEFPAHCSAALLSYPSLGCGNSGSVYNPDNINYSYTLFSLVNSGTFFTNVLTEVMQMFPGQYIHTGGDEVIATGDSQWLSYSPDANKIAALGITGTSSTQRRGYQYWLSTNLTAFLKGNGRTMCGWSEMEDYATVTNAVLFEWETDKGNLTASNGQQVVMAPNGINYYQEDDVNTTNNEPFFQVGNGPSYATLSGVYSYEPVPSTLNPPWTTNIIGAQVNLWTEFVPSPLNVEYKIFPRACAESEVTWTPKAQKNYSDFTARLAADEQRLAAMGLNYNRETNTLIGSWGPSVPTTATTVAYTVTPYITKAGEIDVSFVCTSKVDGLNVYWVALFENGVQVDLDTFHGFAGLANYTQTGSAYGGVAYYVLHLPAYHPGSTYTIQASISEQGSSASTSGNVYLPNWN